MKETITAVTQRRSAAARLEAVWRSTGAPEHDPARVRLYRRRIIRGAYDGVEVAEEVARRILRSGDARRPPARELLG